MQLDWMPPQQLAEYRRIEVRRLAGAIGAEISGIDLARDLDDETVAEIRHALLENLVVFFRDQSHITPAQQVAFARRFGTIIPYPMLRGLVEQPEVVEVVKMPEERHNFGGVWHADTTYLEEPPMGSILLARELPPYGGDTVFANSYLAYETLSPGMRAFLDDLTVIQSSAKAEVTKSREDRIRGQNEPRQELNAEHPAVTTHPETGRRALNVNRGHSARFKELSEEESTPLLEFLFQHHAKPEFTCRFTWTEGAIAFWDNRACQHYPINDYHGFKRLMHRITLAGEKPRR